MTRALLAAAIAAAAMLACSACSSAPPPKEPARAPAKCASVADHLLELMTPAAKEAPAEQLDAMRRLFNDHCRDDSWSTDAQDCMLAATSLQDVGGRCAEKLTPEQTAAFGTAIESHSEPPLDAGVTGVTAEPADAAR